MFQKYCDKVLFFIHYSRIQDTLGHVLNMAYDKEQDPRVVGSKSYKEKKSKPRVKLRC
jgi:hypothetical protein